MFFEENPQLVKQNEPLAAHCWLRIGGAARYYAEPQSIDELCKLCREAQRANIAIRVLGGGSNLLVRPGGVDGLVLRLVGELANVTTQDKTVVAGGGALLGDLLSSAASAGLEGLEDLAGIPGSVGGAVVCNSGITHDDIGSRVTRVTAVEKDGSLVELDRDALQFGFRQSNLEDVVIAEVELALQPGDAEEITRRLQAAWIACKAAQPTTGSRVAQAFIEPAGYRIAELLDAAGMRAASEGEVAMSSQFPGFLVVNENANAEQVLALTKRIARAVEVQSGIQLQPQLKIW